MKIEMCDDNPFKYMLQEKMISQRAPVATVPVATPSKTNVSSGVSVLKIIGWGLLILFLMFLLFLALWALYVAYSNRSKIQEVQSIQGPAGPPGSPGAPGTQGPIGPAGPAGAFYFIGLGAVTGIFSNGCVKVPTEGVINVPSTDNGFLIFDRRLPETGRLSDQLGNIMIGEDGVYVMYASLQLNIVEQNKPVVVRVYKNNVMFGYYEYFTSGSQSFTIANDYKKGDQIRIAIISDCAVNQVLTDGSFLSVLSS